MNDKRYYKVILGRGNKFAAISPIETADLLRKHGGKTGEELK